MTADLSFLPEHIQKIAEFELEALEEVIKSDDPTEEALNFLDSTIDIIRLQYLSMGKWETSHYEIWTQSGVYFKTPDELWVYDTKNYRWWFVKLNGTHKEALQMVEEILDEITW